MANVSAAQTSNLTSNSTTASAKFKVDSLAFGLLFALGLTVVQRLVGFVRTIVFCRLLPDAQLGQWSLAFSFLMLVAPIAVLGIPGSFGRYVEFHRSRGELKSFLLKVTGIALLSSILLMTIMMLCRQEISWLLFRTDQHVDLVMLMLLVASAVITSNFCFELMESMRQVRLVSWMRLILSVCFASLGIGLILAFDDGVKAVCFAYFIASIAACLPAIWFLRRHWPEISANSPTVIPHRVLWAKLAPFAAWLWVINLLSNLFEASDRYMLLHFSQTTANEAQAMVGQYHSGRFMPMLLIGIATLIGGILMPYLSTDWESGKRRLVGRNVRLAVKMTAIGFTLAGVAVLLLSPFIFDGFLQGRYNSGLSILPLALVYCIWMSIAILAQDFLWVAEKGRLPSLAMIIGLAANIGLNAVMVPRLGLYGAVAATAAANAVVLIAIYLLNMREGWEIDKGVWLLSLFPLVLCGAAANSFDPRA
ncbi:MAG: oligosaccharide flippase family protein, partial [Rubripirellula sp.]|nr:oligosaccharide flippase family protein [Rubripirellula sp.]